MSTFACDTRKNTIVPFSNCHMQARRDTGLRDMYREILFPFPCNDDFIIDVQREHCICILNCHCENEKH